MGTWWIAWRYTSPKATFPMIPGVLCRFLVSRAQAFILVRAPQVVTRCSDTVVWKATRKFSGKDEKTSNAVPETVVKIKVWFI